MRLEAVTVCVDYADFLEQTARLNAGMLDRWVIVTAPGDERTLDVCRHHRLEVVISGDHQNKGDVFNKGRMIERGLHHLSEDGWRIHMDADIALPATTRRVLEQAHLQEHKLYGCDRVLVESEAQWKQLLESNWRVGEHPYLLHSPKGMKLGARLIHDGGYVPIGFFQLWHTRATTWRDVRVRPYPTHHGEGARSDVQFGLQWDRAHRELLPELIVAHLDSGEHPMGSNWRGRRTRRFGCHQMHLHGYGHGHGHGGGHGGGHGHGGYMGGKP